VDRGREADHARAGLGAALRDDHDRAQRLESELAKARADLDRHRGWLATTNGSMSWRMTKPLRSAKRLLPSRRAR